MRKLFEDYEIEGSLVYKVFDNSKDVSEFLDEFDRDVVVKPVGLTGGKGVKIVGDHLKDNEEAKYLPPCHDDGSDGNGIMQR